MSIIVKAPEQIDGIRKSCHLAAQCLKFIEPYVQAGVTTESLDAKIEQFTRDNGAIPAPLNYTVPAIPTPYPKATCISLNEVVCHGIPSDKVILKEGDILNIDVTTILDGYFGDTSKMFIVPPISREASELLEITKQCLDIGIKQVRPGNHFGNIGYEIGRYAMLQRVAVVWQYTGHGVGIAFHEPPSVVHIVDKRDVGPIMEPGNIFTIEPMISQFTPEVKILEDGWTVVTADGGLSAQYEHSVLVLPDGVEILTAV
jgi:methionyl aminopeptidase